MCKGEKLGLGLSIVDRLGSVGLGLRLEQPGIGVADHRRREGGTLSH